MRGFTAIAALAPNRVIGSGNSLPWRIPEDFRHFKRTTQGHAVIMGRNTLQDLGKPLSKRRNIVVSRTLQTPPEGVQLVRTLPESLELPEPQETPFLIGGGQLYASALEQDLVDFMILTHIHRDYTGDVYFPEFDLQAWRITQEQEYPAQDERPAFTIRWYARRR